MSRPSDETDPAQARQVLSLLRRHGWNATSFQSLESGFRYDFQGTDACVCYVDTGRAWVAAGAPIASPHRLVRVAERFAARAAAQGRRAVFFATEARFSQRTRFRTLLIGEQPVWNPGQWEATVAGTSSLRAQLRRAGRQGVEVRPVVPAEVAAPGAPLRRSVEALIGRWQASRALAPMGFLVDVQPFTFADERRYFVAERAGELVGFLAAIPVYARGGWLLEDLVRDPHAPNGTAEALVDAAMRAFAAEGSRYVTLGLAPLAGSVTGPLGLARRCASSIYDFHGVYAFRAKLRPQRWDPIYIATAGTRLPGLLAGSLAIYDALVAFARGRLFRFGVATLLRGPAVVVRLLAALLLPWTLLLALAGDRYFPGRAVKWGWVAFDVVLSAALFVLAARWRRWLGLTLAAAISADAVITAAQVALFDGPRARGVIDVLALALSVAAPTAAALILWNAVGHRRRARPGNRPRSVAY
jgi:phosphatidylglycerol lysyltransferase